MKLTHVLFFLGAIFMTSSCFKDNNGGECDGGITCYTVEPTTLFVTLQLSSSPDGTPVKVRFYNGNVDTGELIDSFTTTNSEEIYEVPVGEDYSAEAEYSDGATTIIAVDGDRLNQDACENGETTCYNYDHTIILDLKLE